MVDVCKFTVGERGERAARDRCSAICFLARLTPALPKFTQSAGAVQETEGDGQYRYTEASLDHRPGNEKGMSRKIKRENEQKR